MLGVLFALCAAVGFGATAFFARLSVQHMRPTSGVIVSLVVGVICTGGLVVAMEGAESLALEWTQIALLFLTGLASFVGGRLLNFVAVSKIGVARSSPVVGANPLVAVALAILLLGETPSLTVAMGAISIIIGVVVVLSK
ncbi:MAG: DMT family transporter [Chloroflexi bacterium]|nr:DMT family transporter [Chloroflexota bacterium]